jgi:hypothetical protein
MTHYEIKPAVESDGTPTWALVRTVALPFVCGSKVIAVNRDKAVLERSKQHLRPDR